MKTSKKLLSVLLSVLMVVLTVSCLAVCFTASAVSYVEFGSYPQLQWVEKPEFKIAASNATWKYYDTYFGYGTSIDDRVDGSMSRGQYMKFADFFVNGIKYRAVEFTYYKPYATNMGPYASYSYQDDNGFSTNTTYYFSYEPLKWRVVSTSTGLVICDSIIDAQAYQRVVRKENGNYYIGIVSTFLANNYAWSTIRDWLNEDFYNTAFTPAQKAKIQSRTIDNGSNSGTYNPIFLLNENEVSGLSSKTATGTPYARCQGLYAVRASGGGYSPSSWLLRDAGSTGRDVSCVSSSGGFDGAYVYRTSIGIRPACYLTDLTDDTTVNPGLYSAGNKVRTVNVTADPEWGGYVFGGGDYAPGTSVTIKAGDRNGFDFDGWYQGGTRVSTNTSYTFTVPDGTGSLNYTAKFSKEQYTVTVTAGNGGSVTGGGTYLYQDSVTVKATPNSGYHFVGWYKGSTCVSTSKNYTFSAYENVTLKAEFAYDTYTVTATTSGGGTVTGGGTFNSGATATVKATPGSGYHFVGWYEDNNKVSDSLTYTFTVTRDVALKAKFDKNTAAYEVIPLAGEGGTVTGGGTHAYGATATVKATPDSGYHFVGWYNGNNKVSDNQTYTITVSEDVTLTAKFEKDTAATYTVTATTSGGGTVTGGGTFTEGATATVKATPNSGYHFTGWYKGGSKVSGDASYSFTVTENVTLTAKFEKDASSGDNGGNNNNNNQPANRCHWCGKTHDANFFQKIIGFFHNIFAKIFGNKY